MTPRMMVVVRVLASCHVHVPGGRFLMFLFTTPSTGFFSSSSSFTLATIGIRLLKHSSYCMQGCTGCLYWKMARFFRTSTWLLDWKQTKACVYVSFWNLGQNQEYLLDLDTCAFVCLVTLKMSSFQGRRMC